VAGKIFLNYRRSDAEAWADRLYERLTARLPQLEIAGSHLVSTGIARPDRRPPDCKRLNQAANHWRIDEALASAGENEAPDFASGGCTTTEYFSRSVR